MSIELLKTFLLLVSGGLQIFLAITVTRDNFRGRLNRAAGGLLFFAGLGPLALALARVVQTGQSVTAESAWLNLYLLWEMFFPTLLVFSWIFPADRLRDFKHPRLRFLIFAPQVAHIILALLFSNINRLVNALTRIESQEGFVSLILTPFVVITQLLLMLVGFILSNEALIFGTVNLIYVALAIYFIESGRRFLTNPRLLPQATMVTWALRIGLGLYVVALLGSQLVPEFVTDSIRASICLAAALSGTVFFALAIVRYQFLDVRLVFRQSLIFTVTSALMVGIYLVIGISAADFLRPIFGENASLVSYILIVFLLLFFQPINTWIDNVIRSMFMSTRSDHRNIIERFSRQVITILDPQQLRQAIEETMKTSLLVESVYFVLYDDSVGEYAILASDDHQRRTIIDREDVMLGGINQLDRPAPFDTLQNYKDGSTLARNLGELDIKLILPLKDTEHLVGFLALSSKVAGYRYSPEDYNLLGVLSNQMVSALTNARLYADSLERARLQEEVSMARQIQLDLLPSRAPELDCSIIAANSIPSRTIGGDFYDFIPINGGDGGDRLGVVIADASGKGMPAALMIAQTQAIIHAEVNHGNTIANMMVNMNQQIARA
ncbi:MAG: SpoIIE family protein phosphatase, partial [candidate division Zixibacteria bacterium]